MVRGLASWLFHFSCFSSNPNWAKSEEKNTSASLRTEDVGKIISIFEIFIHVCIFRILRFLSKSLASYGFWYNIIGISRKCSEYDSQKSSDMWNISGNMWSFVKIWEQRYAILCMRSPEYISTFRKCGTARLLCWLRSSKDTAQPLVGQADCLA